MSPSIWTPDALQSDLRPFTGLCWRLVEAQHWVSTVPLVDTLDEQARLEQILDETKPAIPPQCRHLDPLLSTPFRYAPYDTGSRFRRARQRDGVYYSAERVETAAAEMAFYRVLFFAESPGTKIGGQFTEYTAFAVGVASVRVIDLTTTPDPRLRVLADYRACQDFADAARAAQADGIRATSVRCPNGGPTLSWLTCQVFTEREPSVHQSWRMRLTRRGVQAVCENPRLRLEFAAAGWSSDPRTAEFDWSRAP
jgi:RES domain